MRYMSSQSSSLLGVGLPGPEDVVWAWNYLLGCYTQHVILPGLRGDIVSPPAPIFPCNLAGEKFAIGEGVRGVVCNEDALLCVGIDGMRFLSRILEKRDLPRPTTQDIAHDADQRPATIAVFKQDQVSYIMPLFIEIDYDSRGYTWINIQEEDVSGL